MTDDKKQAALEMANEELEQHTELKAGQDTTDVNSKYGDAPDLHPKEDDDEENEEDQEDLDEDQEGEEEDEEEENAHGKQSGDNSEEDEEDAVEDINVAQNEVALDQFQNQERGEAVAFNTTNPFEQDEDYLYDLELTKKVEMEKLNQIHKASNNLRQNLSHFQGRCAICTLMPPCKHNRGQTEQNETQNPEGDQSLEVQNNVTSVNGQDSLYEISQHLNGPANQTARENNNSLDQHSRIHGNSQNMVNSKTDGTFVNQSTDRGNWNNNYPQNSQVSYSPQKKQYHLEHRLKMAQIQGQSQEINPHISPYSILRSSAQHDIDDSIQSITIGVGPRSTRAQLLQHLALKQKLEKHNQRGSRRNHAVSQSYQSQANPSMQFNTLDPGFQNESMTFEQDSLDQGSAQMPQSIRMRNARGEYQTLDADMSNRNHYPSARGSSYSANQSERTGYRKYQEINKAENRLRIIEEISKYREDKIRREFLKLEDELRQEEQKQQNQVMQDFKMQEYHIQQKMKIAEYQQIKHQREMEKIRLRNQEHKREEQLRHERMLRNEQVKANIQLHHEIVNQQRVQDQMRIRKMGPPQKRSKGGFVPRQQFAFNGKSDFNGEDSEDNYSEAASDKERDESPEQKASEEPDLDEKTQKQRLQKSQMEKLQALSEFVRQNASTLNIQPTQIQQFVYSISTGEQARARTEIHEGAGLEKGSVMIKTEDTADLEDTDGPEKVPVKCSRGEDRQQIDSPQFMPQKLPAFKFSGSPVKMSYNSNDHYVPSLMSSALTRKKPHYKSIAQPIRTYCQPMKVVDLASEQLARKSQMQLQKQTKKVLNQVIKTFRQKCSSLDYATGSESTTIEEMKKVDEEIKQFESILMGLRAIPGIQAIEEKSNVDEEDQVNF